MATERADRIGPGEAGSGRVGAATELEATDTATQAAAVDHLRAALSGVHLAIAVIDLDDTVVSAVSEACADALGLPPERIVGRPVGELLDPADRAASGAALAAMRTGAIEFYRAHRHVDTPAAPKTGFCAWVRRVNLTGHPHAFIRLVDPRVPPGPWPSGADVFDQAVAVAVTDAQGVVRTGSVCSTVDDEFALKDLLGLRVVPARHVDNLVTLADWRAARIDGVSIAYPASLRNRSGRAVPLEAIATALAGPKGWLVVLVREEPMVTAREAELEGHLWRIAAEVEASGILMHAGAMPRMSLARIPEAASLTPRQWEVLRRIVAGQRVPTIASELFVSQSTVRNHLAAIFERFGVHSQAALLARLTPTDAPSA